MTAKILRALPANALLACCVVCAFASAAAAADYPARPIRLLVPLVPGGLTDILARLVALKLTQAWGQSVIVDNRPGASGIIASEIVARAQPDGYTLIAVAMAHAVNASIQPKLPYDTLRDFTPIAYLGDVPQVLLVQPLLKINTVRELIAAARARPGQLNYGSGGIGGSSHMAMELFRAAAGIELQHVPYKGAYPALLEFLGGRIDLNFATLSSVVRYIGTGQIIALGVSSPTRVAIAPDIPTIAEAGVPGYESRSWFGLLAPAKTAPGVVTKLNGEVVRIMTSPEVRSHLVSEGVGTGQWQPERICPLHRTRDPKVFGGRKKVGPESGLNERMI